MKHNYYVFKRMNEVISSNGDVYIRCAGAEGQQLFWELKEIGIKVKAFLDTDLKKDIDCCGTPIEHPSEIYKIVNRNFFILIAVKSDNVYNKIEDEFKQHGLRLEVDYANGTSDKEYRMANFKDIVPEYNFFNKSNELAKSNALHMSEIDGDFNPSIPEHYNLISNLDVPLTTYCSLKCSLCSHCMPAVKKPQHFNGASILCDLEKLLKHCYVETMAIMGGEPFIYPDLKEFLIKYSRIEGRENIGFTRIITNGTVLPSDDVFEAFSYVKNGYIYMSNYGKVSSKNEYIKEKCAKFGIKYYINEYSNQWSSLGDFSYNRLYTDDELKHLYAVCSAHYCAQLYDGKIYNCCRLPVLNEDRILPYCEQDFYNLREAEDDLIKDGLHEYLYRKEFLEGCRYCDGMHAYSKKIARGN